MAGAFVELCQSRERITVAVPPPNQQGRIKYGRVFFSLAVDTSLSAAPGATVNVEYAFGAAGNMETHQADLSTGRSNIHEIDPSKGNRQLITVEHHEPAGAPTVCVMVEFETRPDF
jgi:hypothetical protein